MYLAVEAPLCDGHTLHAEERDAFWLADRPRDCHEIVLDIVWPRYG